ncbi:HNH endonuclease [Sphingobacterium lactis]|uniref:HNH endonuclease n=1 Tax=Sphingobacterium TaxID=28453 RepID=UPI0021A6D734|nr:HNH endonuclease [Sphingobacterium hotanense]MCT1526075.1 HNH endonuclease [Sphingobacterium hotanense]
MRPIDKGETPKKSGQDIVVKDYGDWRAHLIERVGYYCVYCNVPLSHSLNVEHVVAKAPREGQPAGDYLAWENMLLACGPCNGAKGNQPTDKDTLYLPEFNNTLMAFEIVENPDNPKAAKVIPKEGLSKSQRQRALNTIDLLGLDVIDNRAKVVDIRWRKRKAAMLAADAAYLLYGQIKLSNPDLIPKASEYIARNAAEIGFFGIWFSVFKDEPTVIERLLDPDIIPGTAKECFNAEDYTYQFRNPESDEDKI